MTKETHRIRTWEMGCDGCPVKNCEDKDDIKVSTSWDCKIPIKYFKKGASS